MIARYRIGFAALALLVLVSLPAPATTIVLDFDTDFSSNPTFSGELLNTAYPSADFTFGADDVIVQTGGGVHSLPNFATGSPDDFTSPLDVLFTGLADSVGAWNVSGSSWTLTAYDALNNVLGSVSNSGFQEFDSLTFAGQIKRAQFTTTDQYGIDDLTLGVSSAPVPEPATMTLLTVGAVGFIRRRLKKRVAL